jgi:hypothetical protein
MEGMWNLVLYTGQRNDRKPFIPLAGLDNRWSNAT